MTSPLHFLRIFAVCAGIAFSGTTWAWGSQGHRLVGLVADAELSPKARIAVHRIMGADSLTAVANWMDEVRGTPEGRSMQRWHFVTTKVCGRGEPTCKDGNCVTDRIEWARDALKSGSRADALKALSVLVHLVGDIHQPLHAADNDDHGANGVVVLNRTCAEFGSRSPTACKLHTYWDTNLVKIAARGQAEKAAANAWSKAYGPLPVTDTDAPETWAAESFQLATHTAYRFEGFACRQKHLGFEVTDEYDAVGVSTIQSQIAKAGKRLARMLNAIFA
ncbi:S1/P1 nuclease [Roseateles saccharophilus]|uniref:S1/P1 nuclease n=1 Tax=Roseateles saccharophilus TaxID=304 RepID=UPI00286D0873|nr:S1/P1 nuclease [Roseateles saccharophilus]